MKEGVFPKVSGEPCGKNRNICKLEAAAKREEDGGRGQRRETEGNREKRRETEGSEEREPGRCQTFTGSGNPLADGNCLPPGCEREKNESSRRSGAGPARGVSPDTAAVMFVATPGLSRVSQDQ